jgi:ADP-dependent NAD(P)H-hydrate dehydratase / NAD(P)H-hydrate epimerase
VKFPLLPRKKNTDKRSYGHVLVAAGSEEYPGAALITARAALVAGAGLVTLVTPAANRATVLKKFPPEIMPVFYRGSPLSLISRLIKERRITTLAVGPGLGRKPPTAAWVRKLVRSSFVPVVLDADGLNAFVGRAKELKKRRAQLVMTPHAGEFQRLFGQKWPAEPAERAALAKRLSELHDSVLVVKGHQTTVAWRARMFTNKTGELSLTASNLIESLPQVFRK